jgi:hypothetical protein
MLVLRAACQYPGDAFFYSGGGAPTECTYTPERSMHIVFLHRVHHYTNLVSSFTSIYMYVYYDCVCVCVCVCVYALLLLYS